MALLLCSVGKVCTFCVKEVLRQKATGGGYRVSTHRNNESREGVGRTNVSTVDGDYEGKRDEGRLPGFQN